MNGFKSAYCHLPEYKWDEITGFDDSEMNILLYCFYFLVVIDTEIVL